ncbi:PD-(D/E)XK nuclease family protein [Microbacterium sp. Mu-80]|uniref:PD-(D/E)XK nuclease family protein n=1 Tax=Microbacterium bandirmense TaxID=3122050 RepID=A0ABU8LEP9_9MICO
MSTGNDHRPLLGTLAGRAGLGETFATEALGVILQSSGMRAALLRFLEQNLSVDLSGVAHVLTEVDHSEFGRTDIEGQDASGRPLVIIEAKFGATLTVDQAARYLALQASECAGHQSALVLLMPKARTEDAAQLMRRAAGRVVPNDSAMASVSWTEILDVLTAALGENDRGPRSLEADLIQLNALVEARTRFVLEPLGGAAMGEEWQTRRAELVGLVDIATQQLADHLGVWRGPQVARRDIAYAPSYYLKAAGPVPGTHFSVGLHSGFASEGLTPMWLRFHKVTGERLAVKRIRGFLGDAPRYAPVLRNDGGHLWVPIDLDPHQADEALVESVVEQVVAILVEARAESAERELKQTT